MNGKILEHYILILPKFGIKITIISYEIIMKICIMIFENTVKFNY